MGWDGSPGGVKYRVPYGANNWAQQLSHEILVVARTIIKVQPCREELVAWLDLCGAEINVSKITGLLIFLHQQMLDSDKYETHANNKMWVFLQILDSFKYITSPCKSLNVSVSIWFHCDLHEAAEHQVQPLTEKSFDCSWKTSRFSQLSDADHPHDVDACRRVACGRVGDERAVCRVDVLLRRLQQVFFHPSFFEALYVLMQEMQPLFAFQLNATPQWNNCHSGSQLQY